MKPALKPDTINLTYHYDPKIADVSSKNLDANERGYALIGKPEDMHTWFFLYDETLRQVEIVDNAEAATNHNYGYGGGGGSVASTGGLSGGGAYGKKVDMTGSLSVPNLDVSENMAFNNANNYGGHAPHHGGGHTHQPGGGPGVHPAGGVHSHQAQAQRNFMMHGHAQSLHVTPPPPHSMGGISDYGRGGHAHHHHVNHHHAHHHGGHGGGLSSHHSRSVPSVAAAVGGVSSSYDPYSSHTSLNQEAIMPAGGGAPGSRPHSRNHSHHCIQQGCACDCDYPSG